ncbi:MAG: hypothetical protein LM577_08360 [Thermoproteaceae archaeon]|nr:hypothetical protein [Thermoproteaceae archaeon]
MAESCAARLSALPAASPSLVALVNAVLLPAAPALVLVHALCTPLPYLALARARNETPCGALGAAAFAASLCIVMSLRDLALPDLLGLAPGLLAREGRPHAAGPERTPARARHRRACVPGVPLLCLPGAARPRRA